MIRDGSTIAISLRPRSTLTPTLVRARIPTIRLTPRTLASCACALTGAVDLTSVAGSTDEGRCATTSAQKASKRFGHRRSSNNQRAHRHTSTSVLCLQHARTRWVGRGTASVWLATFKPMSCLFSPVVAGALQRPRAVTLRPRPPTAVEAVNLTIHRSHSTAAATNKNTQGTENDSPSPARSNVLRLSLAAGNAPFYTAINIPRMSLHSTHSAMPDDPA